MSNDPIDRTGLRRDFWKRFPLEELPLHEWEALCDGCGRCCMLKLEDEDTGRIAYTNIACRLFDDENCNCGNYPLRKQLVKTCVIVRPDNLEEILHWMPATCAYKLIGRGQALERLAPVGFRYTRQRGGGWNIHARAHSSRIRGRRRRLA